MYMQALTFNLATKLLGYKLYASYEVYDCYEGYGATKYTTAMKYMVAPEAMGLESISEL